MKDYSNYHNTNENQKISHDGLLLLERSLNGFEGYEVLINNSIESKVLVYQKYDAESTVKKVIGRISDVEIGNVITIDDANWLVITVPEDNKIYRKAEIQLCNSTYHIKSNKTKVLKGHDQYNRPVYEEIYEIDRLEPCIVEMGIVTTNTDKQLVIPERRIIVTLQYQQSDTLKENYEFTMYNNIYKIIDIDYTKVINNKGVMKIVAEREVG